MLKNKLKSVIISTVLSILLMLLFLPRVGAEGCLTSIGTGKGNTGQQGSTSLECAADYCGRTFPIELNGKKWKYAIYGVRLSLMDKNKKYISGTTENYWAHQGMLDAINNSTNSKIKVKKLYDSKNHSAEGSNLWSFEGKALRNIDEKGVTFAQYISSTNQGLSNEEYLNVLLNYQSKSKYRTVQKAYDSGVRYIKVQPIFVFRYKTKKNGNPIYYYYAGTSKEIYNAIKNSDGAKTFLYDDTTWNVIKNYLTSVYQKNDKTNEAETNKDWYGLAGTSAGVGYIQLNASCSPKKKYTKKIIVKVADASNKGVTKLSEMECYSHMAKVKLQKKEGTNWVTKQSKTYSNWCQSKTSFRYHTFSFQVAEGDNDNYRVVEEISDGAVNNGYKIYSSLTTNNFKLGANSASINFNKNTSTKYVYFANYKPQKKYTLKIQNFQNLDGNFGCLNYHAYLQLQKKEGSAWKTTKIGNNTYIYPKSSSSNPNTWCATNKTNRTITLTLPEGQYRVREAGLGRKNLTEKVIEISDEIPYGIRFKLGTQSFKNVTSYKLSKTTNGWYSMGGETYYYFNLNSNKTLGVLNYIKTKEKPELTLNVTQNGLDYCKNSALCIPASIAIYHQNNDGTWSQKKDIPNKGTTYKAAVYQKDWSSSVVLKLEPGRYKIREQGVGKFYDGEENASTVEPEKFQLDGNFANASVTFSIQSGIKYPLKYNDEENVGRYMSMPGGKYVEFDLYSDKNITVHNVFGGCSEDLKIIKDNAVNSKKALFSLYSEYPNNNKLLNFLPSDDDASIKEKISDGTISCKPMANESFKENSCSSTYLNKTNDNSDLLESDNEIKTPIGKYLNNDNREAAFKLGQELLGLENVACIVRYGFNYKGVNFVKSNSKILGNTYPSNKLGNAKLVLRCEGISDEDVEYDQESIKNNLMEAFQKIEIANENGKTLQTLSLSEEEIIDTKNKYEGEKIDNSDSEVDYWENINESDDNNDNVADTNNADVSNETDINENEFDSDSELLPIEDANLSDSEEENQIVIVENGYYNINISFDFNLVYDKKYIAENSNGTASTGGDYLNYGYGVIVGSDKSKGNIKLIPKFDADTTIYEYLKKSNLLIEEGDIASCPYEFKNKFNDWKVRFIDVNNPFPDQTDSSKMREYGSNWNSCEVAKNVIGTISNVSKHDIDGSEDYTYCKYGDINCDGKINSSDWNEINDVKNTYVNTKDNSQYYQKKLADVDKDGFVSDADLRYIGVVLGSGHNPNCDGIETIYKETFINNIKKKFSNSSSGDQSSSSTPMYSFTLTPSSIKSIRNYNKENPYNDSSKLECDEDTGYCLSPFITSLLLDNNEIVGERVLTDGICLNDYVQTKWLDVRSDSDGNHIVYDTSTPYANEIKIRSFCPNSAVKNQ